MLTVAPDKAPGLTVRLRGFVAVAPPEAVPVTVIVKVPVWAEEVAVKVTVTAQFGEGVQVGGEGVKFGVTPLGRAERLNVTGWEVPLVKAAVRVTGLLVVPWLTLMLLGETVTAKTKPLWTVRKIWALGVC